MKEDWKKAWSMYRTHAFTARQIGNLHGAAAACWRSREHMNRMPPVVDYHHRRRLGQSPGQALKGALSRTGRLYTYEGW
jgi:hypothetical protein